MDHRLRGALIPLLALCALIAPGGVSQGAAERSPTSVDAVSPYRSPQYGALPVSFEPNVGQVNARVLYLAQGPGYTAYFTAAGIILSFQTHSSGAGDAVTVQLAPVGGARHPRIVAEGRLPGVVNYLIGKDR